MGILIGILIAIVIEILMGILMEILMGIWRVFFMGILIMDLMGGPYDSFDCLSFPKRVDSYLTGEGVNAHTLPSAHCLLRGFATARFGDAVSL